MIRLYFTNINDSELSQYHSLVLNDFKMTLTDVLSSDLFKVEEIVSDSIFKVYPLFYCNEIKSNNYDDNIIENRCVICKKETDTILSFNTIKEIVTDIDFGYSVYNGALGVVVYCYDTNTNIPLSDIVLTIETSKNEFNIMTGENGAYTYYYDNEMLVSIKYGNTTLYDVSNTSYIDYYGNGLISSLSSGTLTGTDLKLLFEDDVIINYVNKNSLNHNIGTGLHTLIIEGTLTNIGATAFSNCIGLRSISLPNVNSIGDGAFSGCSSLQSVSLPSVTSIENYAFDGCTGLQSVSLPSVTNIRTYAFYYCTGLQSVSLPSVTSIGNYAFSGCSSLQSISFNWSTSETILTYKSRWGMPNATVFSIPPNTKSLYESKGYPSNRLVERSQ